MRKGKLKAEMNPGEQAYEVLPSSGRYEGHITGKKFSWDGQYRCSPSLSKAMSWVGVVSHEPV